MQIHQIERIGEGLHIRSTPLWQQVEQQVHSAIGLTDWPHGSGSFLIYPESGKKRGMGNGVVPIKVPCIKSLKSCGWIAECYPKMPNCVLTPGDFDALVTTPAGHVVLEWETGNISSSHRAINKIMAALGTAIIGAYLVLPSKSFAYYLTDRIGNVEELRPYFDYFRKCCPDYPFDIISVSHDGTSLEVPKIPKGKDGRALG